MKTTLDEFTAAIRQVTTVYRKGPVVEQRPGVTEVWGYPHVDEVDPTETKVDLVFVVVGVKPTAKERAEEFMRCLIEWHSPTLPGGPSYIHTGGELGSQELALRLFAILQVLGFAKITTAADLGFDDEAEIRDMAGKGLLYAVPTPRLREAVA